MICCNTSKGVEGEPPSYLPGPAKRSMYRTRPQFFMVMRAHGKKYFSTTADLIADCGSCSAKKPLFGRASRRTPASDSSGSAKSSRCASSRFLCKTLVPREGSQTRCKPND